MLGKLNQVKFPFFSNSGCIFQVLNLQKIFVSDIGDTLSRYSTGSLEVLQKTSSSRACKAVGCPYAHRTRPCVDLA